MPYGCITSCSHLCRLCLSLFYVCMHSVVTILALASLFNPFIALVSASSVIGALCILLLAPLNSTAFLAFSSSKYAEHFASNNGVVTSQHALIVSIPVQQHSLEYIMIYFPIAYILCKNVGSSASASSFK